MTTIFGDENVDKNEFWIFRLENVTAVVVDLVSDKEEADTEPFVANEPSEPSEPPAKKNRKLTDVAPSANLSANHSILDFFKTVSTATTTLTISPTAVGHAKGRYGKNLNVNT